MGNSYLLYVGLGVAVVIILGIIFSRGGSSNCCCGSNKCSAASDDEIKELAQSGQKIKAIKEYRALHGVGLKEAKDAVDSMVE